MTRKLRAGFIGCSRDCGGWTNGVAIKRKTVQSKQFSMVRLAPRPIVGEVRYFRRWLQCSPRSILDGGEHYTPLESTPPPLCSPHDL
jgi:hypothetical protein